MTVTTDLPAICELARYSQWVCWRKEQRDGKPTKVPYNARTGELASSTRPDTWSTFEQATAAAPRYDGIGFVLTAEDPYTGVDLDHCIENGVVARWAITIISTLNSYCEVTPSGAGLRLFVRGKLPPGGRKRGNVEMYETGRYLTVTGAHWPGTPATIEEREDTLATLHPRIFTEPTTNGGHQLRPCP